MTVKDVILRFIAEKACVSVPVVEQANLYAHLGFDSLSFIDLLVEIEGAFSIDFDISEMEACLEVKQLIAMAESKIKERGCGNDPTFTANPGKP